MSPRSRMIWSAVLILGIAGVSLAFWRSMHSFEAAAPTAYSLRPDEPGLVESGRKIYTAHCAACHGAMLEGQAGWQQRRPDGRMPAPPHDATGHTWHHSDEQLFRFTKFGLARSSGLEAYQSDMPAFENVLTDEQITAVLSWIKAQWPDAVRMQHNAINRRARAGY